MLQLADIARTNFCFRSDFRFGIFPVLASAYLVQCSCYLLVLEITVGMTLSFGLMNGSGLSQLIIVDIDVEAKGVAIGTIKVKLIGSSMTPQADMTRDGDEQCQRLAYKNDEEKANRLLSSSANMFEQFEQSGHLTDLSTAISYV